MIERGLDQLRAIGASGCVVLGDPSYYTRFGFARDARLIARGIPAEFFMVFRLANGNANANANGEVRYHEAFGVEDSKADPVRRSGTIEGQQ